MNVEDVCYVLPLVTHLYSSKSLEERDRPIWRVRVSDKQAERCTYITEDYILSFPHIVQNTEKMFCYCSVKFKGKETNWTLTITLL